jgi:hypothetical protein
MKRATVAHCLSLALAFGLLPSAARADQPYLVSIDGRPLTSDTKDTGASLHDGVVYVDAVKFTKAFSGLLTFQKHTLVLTIDHHTANFRNGRPSMELDGKMVKLAGTPFMVRGDLYVPLTAIASVARAKVSIDKPAAVAHVKTAFRPPVASGTPAPRRISVPTASPSVAPTGS